jgi:lipopolysaccharide export system permease protein
MPRIVDRYLVRELLGSFFAVGAVLFVILLGGTLAGTLDRVARGKIPATLLISQIGLRSVEFLPVMLPLAVFLAVLLAYGRLYRDSEMAVLSASGLTTRGLLRPVAWVALPLVGVLVAVAFWLGPAALRLSDAMIDSASRSLLVVGLEAGRFVELPGGQGVVYVGSMAADGTRFQRLFVANEKERRVDITTAERGELYQDRDNAERYLALHDGFRVEGELGKPDFRTMRFDRNDIRLPDAQEDSDRAATRRSSPFALLAARTPADLAELHWRLGLPLSALVLAVLAVPLARAQPREPRYGKALVAVLAYVVYSNLLALGRVWLADGTLPPSLGLWWVHAGGLAIALILIRQGERQPAPRAARR